MNTLGANAPGSWLGVAVSRTEIVAYDSRLKAAGSAAWRMALDAPAADQVSWPSVAIALRTLKQLSRESNGHLAVALMPSLAEVRRVDVPPLSEDEVEAVLSRNASKYFVGAQGAQLVGVETNRPSQNDGAIAAAAPAWVVRQISLAAREAGWKLEHVAPAEAAWGLASVNAFPVDASRDSFLLAHQADHTHALTVRQGRVVMIRRYRSAVVDVPVFLESHVAGARVLAFGEPRVRKQWLSALGERSISVALPVGMSADVSSDAALVAAAYVVDVQSLVFRTEEMRIADQKRRNSVMYTICAAAVVLLMASAGFTWWDVSRELGAVKAERAEIKPQLTTTLLGRSSVETVSNQLQILARNERESAHWSVVIADLTKHLPDEAHLTGFRGWSDSVRFDGLAERAASVFAPLAKAESFSGLKAAAAVRLEPQVDGSSMEKFTLVGKVRPRNIAPLMTADSAKSVRTGAARNATKGAP
ncbi:MAG: hypothetical protein ABI120_25970 [Gemmatimonadaceae bacterium]